MSTNKEQLIDLLVNDTNKGLQDVKLFLGFDRFLSEEDICGEMLSAEKQVLDGSAKSVQVSVIDGNSVKMTSAEFLAS